MEIFAEGNRKKSRCCHSSDNTTIADVNYIYHDCLKHFVELKQVLAWSDGCAPPHLHICSAPSACYTWSIFLFFSSVNIYLRTGWQNAKVSERQYNSAALGHICWMSPSSSCSFFCKCPIYILAHNAFDCTCAQAGEFTFIVLCNDQALLLLLRGQLALPPPVA